MKEFADKNFNVIQMVQYLGDKVENIMEKGENAGYQHFLLFPLCFHKSSFARSLKVGIVCYGINPFPNKPWFLPVCCMCFLKTLWEKEKLLITSNFSFSHSVFYLFGEHSAIFVKFEIVVCKLFQFRRV